jgi:hypothetical protein
VEQPGADGGLARVDPGGPDTHDPLSRGGDRAGNLDDLEHVDIAVAIEPDGLGH